MNKEDIIKYVPEIGEEAAEAILKMHDEEKEELLCEVKRLSALSENEESARQEAYENGFSEAERRLMKKERERMIENKIGSSGAKSTKALRAMLKAEEIVLEDGELLGFDEQVESIRAECPFLFEEDDEKPRFTSGFGKYENKGDIKKLSYRERLKLYTESPELYHQLVK